jgi:hypothetical protein
LTVKADFAVEKDVKNLYAEIQMVFGKHAHVLLNNTEYLDYGKLVGEQSVDDWWTGFVCKLPLAISALCNPTTLGR